MRGLIDNSVNLGGEQTITGAKKFMQTNIDVDVLPDDILRGAGLTFVDKNGVRIGKIEPRLQASGYMEMATSAQNNDKYAIITGRVKADGTNNIYTSAKSEDNNTVVTTVSHVFNTYSGYIKLGNGLIIQWGRASNTITNSLMSITFPTPFTEATSYSAVGCSTLANNTNQGHDYVSSLTATNFKFQLNSDMGPANWIAIGR